MLARDERNALIVAEVAKGKSLRAAAEVVGVDHKTAAAVVRSAAGANSPAAPSPTIPAKLTGRDGKVYPSTKPSPEALEARAERVEEARTEGKSVEEIAEVEQVSMRMVNDHRKRESSPEKTKPLPSRTF